MILHLKFMESHRIILNYFFNQLNFIIFEPFYPYLLLNDLILSSKGEHNMVIYHKKNYEIFNLALTLPRILLYITRNRKLNLLDQKHTHSICINCFIFTFASNNYYYEHWHYLLIPIS